MDSKTIKYLELFKSRSSLSMIQLSAILNTSPFAFEDALLYLKGQGYIRVELNHAILAKSDLISPDTPLEITYEGEAALSIAKSKNRSAKLNELRAWLTAAIAVAAFIKSFFF